MEDTKARQVFAIEAILALLSPAIAYLLAFRYQMGFFDYWGIPVELMSFGLTTLVATWATLVGAGFVLLVYVNIILTPMINDEKTSWVIVHYSILASLFILPPIMIYREYWREWAPQVSLYGGFIVATVLLSLLTQKGIKGWIAKIEAAEEAEKSRPFLLQRILQAIGPRAGLVYLVLLSAYIYSYHLGKNDAMRQKDFLTLPDTQSVVLRLYEERAIVGYLNSENSSIANSYSIIHFDDESAQFVRRSIGSLSPPKLLLDSIDTKQGNQDSTSNAVSPSAEK